MTTAASTVLASAALAAAGRGARRAALCAGLAAPLVMAPGVRALAQSPPGSTAATGRAPGVAIGVAPATASGPGMDRQGGGRAGPEGAENEESGVAPARRRLLEQRLRQRLEQIVQARLHLTNDQVVRLRETNRRFAGQRRALADREREARRSMRAELRPGAAPNQQHLSALIDSLFVLQRQRLDMLQAEQRELAGYLTPLQRVQYYGLQEQLRNRLEQIRRRRAGFDRGDGQGAGADTLPR